MLRRDQVAAAWSPEEERAEYLAFIRHCWNGPNAVRAPAPQSWITVPFSHGRISVHSFEPEQFLQQDRQLIEIFADAVSLAYTRLLDFRHLEAQHTEIQLAYGKLKETQAELVQAEKMAALGGLVAGVAHEINTPLGAIKSTIDTAIRGIEKVEKMVVDEPPESGKVATIFGRITHLHRIMQDAVERIDLIVGNLRKFARLDAPALDTVSVHEGLDSTLLIVAHELKNHVEVTKEYGVIPDVQCYPNQLNQVFMNLLVNAGQAIEGKGRITIRTARRDDDVVVSFADTGRGIAPDHLQRIFDPGFTTKGVGVGMGLGLSIVHQIIESHHGRVEVDSQLGEGTAFSIVLPVHQPIEESQAAERVRRD
ncbi:MAG: ATPase [Candidatus Latescibacteria bacterium]|nr:ATPase [Candidatus Latescibacterota bacterium]